MFISSSLILLIAGTILWFEIERVFSFSSVMERLSSELEQKSESIAEFREQIAFYKTDEGIAHLGREIYNFTYPNERIYLLDVSWDQK